MLPSTAADIRVEAPSGHALALVEVKNRQDLTASVATALRRNFAAHGMTANADFFLLLTQEVGYLWDQRRPLALDASPTAHFPMHAVVSRYFPNLEPLERLRGSELELIIVQWIADLIERPLRMDEEPERSLIQLGFLDAIAGGRVSVAQAA